MKGKAVGLILALVMFAVFLYGCGGGGGNSNPASPVISGNAKVSGVVVDSSKKPVADVSVRLVLTSNSLLNFLPSNIKSSLRLSATENTTEFNTITDNNGRYTFENVPYGRYSLSVNAGDQGALLPNLEVSSSETTVSEQTVTPFGFVTGKVVLNDGNNTPVYGAMVSVADNSGNPVVHSDGSGNGYQAFTNNNGIFTLRYIPVGEEYYLTASLNNNYEQEKTAKFTIKPTEKDLTHDCGTIKLNAKNVDSYNVTVSVDVPSNTTITYPIYVIARGSDNVNNIYFNTINNNNNSENKNSCELKITQTGNYTLSAISSDMKYRWSWKDNDNRTQTLPVTTISGSYDGTINLKLDSSSSSNDPTTGGGSTANSKTVVIKKIELPESFGDGMTVAGSSYFDGYLSVYSPSYGWGYKNIKNNSDLTVIQNSALEPYNTFLCGNSIAYYEQTTNTDEENSGYKIYWQLQDQTANTLSIKSLNSGGSYLMPNINRIALIPGEFVCVGYSYWQDSTTDNGLKGSKLSAYSFNQSSNSGNSTSQESPQEYHSFNTDSTIVYDLLMAKDKDGNCYLAALYSEKGLKIYNVSDTTDTNEIVVVTDSNFNPYNLNDFQVLTYNNSNLFYVEGTSGSDNTLSRLYNDLGNMISESTSTNLKGCFVDSDGNTYRYDSTQSKVVKINGSISSGDTTTSSPVLGGTTDTSFGSVTGNSDISGILGFEESDTQVTIYAY